MALTDEAREVDATWDYDAFGAVRATSGSQANDFTFAGEQVDDSTGLQYLRARYYDPATGRFISRDTYPGLVGFPASQNRYVYGVNNPTNQVDPSGNSPCLLVFAAGPEAVVVAVPCWVITVAILGASCSALCDFDEMGDGIVEIAEGVVAVGGDAVDTFGSAVDAVTGFFFGKNDAPEYEGNIEASDLKKVPDGVIKEIGKTEVHGIKGGSPGKKDLYYDPKTGEIYVVPKGGDRTPEPTGRNIEEFQ